MSSLIVDNTKPVNGIYLIKTKVCRMCGVWKPLSNFTTVAKVKNGKNSRCKDCMKDVNKKYYDNYRRKKEEKKEQEAPLNEPKQDNLAEEPAQNERTENLSTL